jgi:hypothetical protein
LVDEADPAEGEVSAFSLVSADGKETTQLNQGQHF